MYVEKRTFSLFIPLFQNYYDFGKDDIKEWPKDKDFNRKDYVAFNKIQSFEVMELTK